MKCNVVIVDDHTMVSKAISELIESFDTYTVLYTVKNGKELIEKFTNKKNIPDFILLDVNMPIMNGFETMEYLSKHYPHIKVLVLSMNNEETSIIKMIKLGASGYILKESNDTELFLAMESILKKGYYHSDITSSALIHNLNTDATKQTVPTFNKRELTFLQYVCSEFTYKEIADKMFLSPKTIDGYRDALFQKLNVKTRVGLVLFVIKNKIISC